MAKRSRTDFEGLSSGKADGSRQIKRVRKDENKKASSITSGGGSEFECPVCYEDFNGAIYQCQEGHLLCDKCRPNLDNCPSCRIPFDGMIRNRILEQILCQNNKNSMKNNKKCIIESAQNEKKALRKPTCCLCSKSFKSLGLLNIHYNNCEYRKITCPFLDCSWYDSFKKWSKHAKEDHHTCIGSIQSLSINNQNNNKNKNKKKKKNKNKDKNKNATKQYVFNHAIKFPNDTFSRQSADFVWPKIVRYDDGTQFFVLSRYNAGFITVFVRLMKLPELNENELKKMNKSLEINNGEGQIWGNYWIEFRIKSDGDKMEKDANDLNLVPLRWPSNLYGITLPFNYEKKNHESLKVHHKIFTRYWMQENVESSAILRFQFAAHLS